jgi:sugar lactone lactonase YvrE
MAGIRRVAGVLAGVVTALALAASPVLAAIGDISTVAGTGLPGFSGDGGPATGAKIYHPQGVVVDAAGNLYIADAYNSRVRRVDHVTGLISTVAGNGGYGFSGDGGPATAAQLTEPFGLALDAAGDLYIADTSNQRIRMVDHATGLISTVAGTGVGGFNGDGGPATGADLYNPRGVAVDASGNLHIADLNNNRVRRVDHVTGLISTVAGTGAVGFSGDGGPATSAQVAYPYQVAFDPAGNLHIVDNGNHRIRAVDHVTGLISTVAGTGVAGFSGDGGPATGAKLNIPFGLAFDGAGNLFIADKANYRVRVVDHVTGAISTVAGSGTPGFTGDGGPATAASLTGPFGVAVDSTGNLYIADADSDRVRKVEAIGAPPFLVPEAPFSALLGATAAVIGAGYLYTRRRSLRVASVR